MLCNVKLFLAFEDLYGNMISFNSTNIDSLDILQDIDRAFTERDYPNFFSRKKKKGYLKSHIHSLLRTAPDFSTVPLEHDTTKKRAQPEQIEMKLEETEPLINNSRMVVPKKELKIDIPNSNELVEVEMQKLKSTLGNSAFVNLKSPSMNTYSLRSREFFNPQNSNDPNNFLFSKTAENFLLSSFSRGHFRPMETPTPWFKPSGGGFDMGNS